MKRLYIPEKKIPNSVRLLDVEQNSIVVIGANGSGKTRFGAFIEKTNFNGVTRISAQRALKIPQQLSIPSVEEAEFMKKTNQFYHNFSMVGLDDKQLQNQLNNGYNNRWQNNPVTHTLDDFNILFSYLYSDENDHAFKLRNSVSRQEDVSYKKSKLDEVISIWESLLPHRKFKKLSGKLLVEIDGQANSDYNAAEMSDGERVIFYLITQAICAEPNYTIIIDEPEIHIHKSIINSLFNAIENARTDCLFIYLTHDLDFAASRVNSRKIWTKSYNGYDTWDYEILDSGNPLPEQIFYEILGSRNQVIFIEGELSSLDYTLYQLLYPNFTIKPVGSCERVIHFVKSFNEQTNFHRIKAFGIIDSDRRDENEIQNLKDNNIYSLQVAEIENLFLHEECVYALARKMDRIPTDIFNQVKENIHNFFVSQKDYQITQLTAFKLKRELANSVDEKAGSLENLIENFNSNYNEDNARSIYDNIKSEFDELIEKSNYLGILRVFNNKGVLPTSKLHILCGLSGKEEVINQIKIIIKNGENKLLISALKSLINIPQN